MSISERHTKSFLNKYNVRAIRAELDEAVCYRAWNKLRFRLVALLSKMPELAQAVILAKPKNTSGAGPLLHALLRRHDKCNLKETPIRDLSIIIAKAVPQVLLLQDSHLQTPIHVAIDQGLHPELVETFLEILGTLETTNHGMNEQGHPQKFLHPLNMVDHHGYTPLLEAARRDASQYIPVLLRYDCATSTTSLTPAARPVACPRMKCRIPVWYVASHELKNTTRHCTYCISRELTLVLLSTYLALQTQRGVTRQQEDWDLYQQELHKDCSQNTFKLKDNNTHQDSKLVALLMRSLVACAPLMGKHAVKLLDIVLENEVYRDVIFSQPIDSDGNYMLHLLCMNDTTQLSAEGAASGSSSQSLSSATNALLLDLLLQNQQTAVASLRQPNRSGNLPLHLAITHNHQEYVTALINVDQTATQHVNDKGELPLHIALKVKEDSTMMSPNNSSGDISTIQQIWDKHHGALEIRDGPTDLYAFQLAACREWSQQQPTQSRIIHGDSVRSIHQEGRVLTLIFSMLLAAPQVIQTPKSN